MAKGKTPKPIEEPFDPRLKKEHDDMKKMADEKGGQYKVNYEISYKPKSTLVTKGPQNLKEGIEDIVKTATFLPKKAALGIADLFDKTVKGKDVGKYENAQFSKGRSAKFQREEDIRLGVGTPEKVKTFSQGGVVHGKSFKGIF